MRLPRTKAGRVPCYPAVQRFGEALGHLLQDAVGGMRYCAECCGPTCRQHARRRIAG